MAQLISFVVWSIVAYFIAKNVMENNPDLRINPWNYTGLSLLFGFLVSMCVLTYKWAKARRHPELQIIVCIVIALVAIFNIVILF